MDYKDNNCSTPRSHSYSQLYSIPPSHNTKMPNNHNKTKQRKKSKQRKRTSSCRSSKSSSTSSGGTNSSVYEVLDTVGCGSFAKVSRVRHRTSSEILVWKELSYGIMSDKEKQMLCDEVNILRDLNHPNIVKFIDRIIDHENRKIFIVQEYCDGGDLASYIKLKKEKSSLSTGSGGRISESFIWSVTSEIASALQHCHNHFNRRKKKYDNNKKQHNISGRILHRDLKPGNVFLVKRRGTYSVKLGDFGLAKMLDESSIFAQTHVGTPYYMSPEQIQNRGYNEKSDIWSLGCIVYEMAMLSPPFKASNYLHLAEKIKLGVYKSISSRNYSFELESAISMMLTVDSNKRAKVEELLCLPRIQFTSKMLRLDRRYCQLKKKEYQFMIKMQQFEHKFKKKSMALKLKENQLKLKENELKQKEVFLSISTNSRSTNESNTNSNDISLPSTPDDDDDDDEEKEEEEHEEEEEIEEIIEDQSLCTMSSNNSNECVHDNDGDDHLLDDARKILMKKLNFSDLNTNKTSPPTTIYNDYYHRF